MKILVTGANGQLGSELRNVLENTLPGQTVYTDVDTLDLTDANQVADFIRKGDFTHIVNCAGYTAVDRAEEETGLCKAVNVEAVKNIGRAAAETGARVLHISTDFVFDGNQGKPYTESDRPNPLSHYGETKRKGETALIGFVPEAIIIRTGWLYSSYGHNFVKTILDHARRGETLRVVVDQVGTPTYAADLAEVIVRILTAPRWVTGTYNYSNEGVASWYDLAYAAVRLAGLNNTVKPILSADWPTPATRPHYSVLDKSKIRATFGIDIPNWHDSLARCIEILNKA